MATQAIDGFQRASQAAPAPVPTPAINAGLAIKRDWRTAFVALRKLMANGDDTLQVFRIMRALNADTSHKNYRKLLSSAEGGRIAYHRVDLAQRFSDRAWLDSLPEGSVGAHYRAFLDRTGFSAKGLADISTADNTGWQDVEHPHVWFGQRERDIHDIWHTLTGYTAEEHLGELCLVAFSYAQTKGLGWGAIAAMGSLKSLRQTRGTKVVRAAIEGYRHGKAAKWLHNEDYEKLLAEPLDAARKRLNILPAVKYREAQAHLERMGVAAI
jgi:ubiquinone biosynthesis protein COQ4